ncbi:glycoside hydrolase, family 16 [Caenispirillum salinarum AK4]|uniref:Glycoside hydrolase, family 16 n=1 Tax=Caenispirillum salinarum AK4 TaxID=1238182 RepID=K9GSD0_9PROT|nr:calcium-binding protein [Caenispirillum salinarum]EKV28900.1 glycoside hydrolase, family 16 [Caenispirillum salinarum AK4]
MPPGKITGKTTFSLRSGSTSSDLQRLIDTVPEGSTIQLKPGAYSLDAPITIARDDIAIIGSGSDKTVFEVFYASGWTGDAITVAGSRTEAPLAAVLDADARDGDSALSLAEGHGLSAGDWVWIEAENTDAYLEAVYGGPPPADLSLTEPLRTALVQVKEVVPGGVLLETALHFDFPAAETTMFAVDPASDVTLSGFSIQYPLGEADPAAFTNTLPAHLGDSAVRLEWTAAATVSDIAVHDAVSNAFAFAHSSGIAAEGLLAEGSHNKGAGDNGFAWLADAVHDSRFTGLTDLDMKHSLTFDREGATVGSTFDLSFTNRDIQFLGGRDQGNAITVQTSERDPATDDGSPVYSVNESGDATTAPTDPSANTLSFNRVTGGEGADLTHGTEGDDILDGGGAGDTVYAHGGNDTLYAGTGLTPGADTLDGGAGSDVAVFQGARASYDISAGAAAGEVLVGGHALRNVETARFDDATVDLSTIGGGDPPDPGGGGTYAAASIAEVRGLLETVPDGSTITLAAGTYTLDAPLVIARDDVSIVGAGSDSTVISVTAGWTGDAISVLGSHAATDIAVTADAALWDTALALAPGHGLAAGDWLWLEAANTPEYLDSIGDTLWQQDKPLRTSLVQVDAVTETGVTLTGGLHFDLPAAETTVYKVDPAENVALSGFSMQYSLGEADAGLFENTVTEHHRDRAVELEWTVGAKLSDIAVHDAASNAFVFLHSSGITADALHAEGAHNKGAGGNGYAFELKSVYESAFTGLTDLDMRHSFVFGSWYSNVNNRVEVLSTNRDINFHGGRDHHNSVLVDRSERNPDTDNMSSVLSINSEGETWGAPTDMTHNAIGFETVIGSKRQDLVYGTDNANVIDPRGGHDTVYGYGGDDTLYAGTGDDWGDDQLIGGAGTDTAMMWGVRADYIIRLGTTANQVWFNDHLLDGIETVRFLGDGTTMDLLAEVPGYVGDGDSGTSTGGVTYTATEWPDTFVWSDTSHSTPYDPATVLGFDPMQDTLDVSRIDADTTQANAQAFTWIGAAAFSGSAGEMRMEAGELSADVDGGGTANFLVNLDGLGTFDLAVLPIVGLEALTIPGTSGDDVYRIVDPAHTVAELSGGGHDTVESWVDWTLSDNVEDMTLRGAAEVGNGNAQPNTILGTAGANVLRGEAGDDVLVGGAGDDRLYGGADIDDLSGGEGNDTLMGGGGPDSLSGGPGADEFEFTQWDLGHIDIISDFTAAEDSLDLVRIDANAGTSEDDAFTYIDGTAFSGTAGELRFSAGRLEGDVDGDGLPDLVVDMAGPSSLGEEVFIL